MTVWGVTCLIFVGAFAGGLLAVVFVKMRDVFDALTTRQPSGATPTKPETEVKG